jgi:hypothetical protein
MLPAHQPLSSILISALHDGYFHLKGWFSIRFGSIPIQLAGGVTFLSQLNII